MVKKGQNFVHDVVIECPPFQVPLGTFNDYVDNKRSKNNICVHVQG